MPCLPSCLAGGRSQTTLTRFWIFLTTYPPALTFSMVWTLTKSGHFSTTYLPRLVNVVCERPPIWCLGMCLCVSAVFLLCTNMRFWIISYGETTYPLHSQKKCCFLNSIFQNKLSIFLEKFYQIITRSDLIKHDVISCLVCNPLPVPWILHEVSTSQNHAQKTIIPCINIHSTIFLSVNKSQAFYKPTMKTVSAK